MVPSEGTNLWFDNIVIPKTVITREGVYAFINFMLRPEMQRRMLSMLVMQRQTRMLSLPEDISDESFLSEEHDGEDGGLRQFRTDSIAYNDPFRSQDLRNQQSRDTLSAFVQKGKENE